jgi:drug/metabolite transporter (DMT)-like permease
MGILFAVIAAISQSILWIALKKSYETLSPSVAFFFDMLFGLMIWLPFSLLMGVDFHRLPEILFFALISGILSEAFVFYVFSKGEVSYTSTIFSTYPMFTIFFSIMINHEKLLPAQWAYITLIIFGTLIVAMPSKITRKELGKKSFLIWPLLGALAVGISDTLSKSIINETSASSFLFGLAFAQIPVSLAYLRYEKEKIPKFFDVKHAWSVYKFALMGSLLNVTTVLFLWLAFQYAPASIASPITASYPGFVIILAMLFLKEKIQRKDMIGFFTIISSMIGLSYISGV